MMARSEGYCRNRKDRMDLISWVTADMFLIWLVFVRGCVLYFVVAV